MTTLSVLIIQSSATSNVDFLDRWSLKKLYYYSTTTDTTTTTTTFVLLLLTFVSFCCMGNWISAQMSFINYYDFLVFCY